MNDSCEEGKCENCRGRGVLSNLQPSSYPPSGNLSDVETCEDCKGEGFIFKEKMSYDDYCFDISKSRREDF